jgi:glycosyltransferase involved in cell wall biosynthesis
MNKKYDSKKRLLIFIVAYNAEKTIEDVLSRIPKSLAVDYHVEVLVIDDSSEDQTFERGIAVQRANALPFALHIMFNPVNQGYGGNQKLGFHFAIKHGFDFVALVHGDGQYAPECLPKLVIPLAAEEADAVFGSRMLTRGAARDGGMPLYKFVGNKILTGFQNWALRSNLSEFHSGYRLYSVATLKRIPFDLNTNVFHFDTEIIIQLMIAGQRINEIPIPTYYGDEICHVDGFKYAWDVTIATLKARAQELSIFYDRKFDCRQTTPGISHYEGKLKFKSPHTVAIEEVRAGARVLDLGCADGTVAKILQRKNCSVTAVDRFPLKDAVEGSEFILHDLNNGLPDVDLKDFDYVLMLDVIEHLLSPEAFVDELRAKTGHAQHTKLVISTGNIGFFIARMMLLFGQFNYGKRGILDLTHTRLFTFNTLRRLFEQAGFEVVLSRGLPAPFPLAFGENMFAKAALGLNQLLIQLWKAAFSYQIYMVVRPRPSLEALLEHAYEKSAVREEQTSIE